MSADDRRLARDLRRHAVVGKAGGGEDGQLLAAHHRVQAVDRGDAGLDELRGEVTGVGVHRHSVDVQLLLGDQGSAAVDGVSAPVEDAPQHITGCPCNAAPG